MLSSLILYAIMLTLVLIAKKGDLLTKLGFKKNIEIGRESTISLAYLLLLLIISITIGLIAAQLGMHSDIEKVPSIIKNIPLREVLAILLIGSFIEEVFFRGYLQKKTNIWVASFIFSFFHIVYGSVIQLIGTFFLGLALGHEYEKTKGVYAPILTHTAYNLIVVTIMFTI